MIRKVAVGIGVAILLVVMGWLGMPSRAYVGGCTFEWRPRVVFKNNHLHVIFVGRKAGDLLYELKRAYAGGFAREGRGLSAELLLHGVIEPGVFPIDGVVVPIGSGWNFQPGPGNSAKIWGATIQPGAELSATSASRMEVRGTLMIDRVSETELAGRLHLSSPDPGGGWGPVQISSPFSTKLERGETVDTR